MTDRLIWNRTSPATQFALEADYVGMSIDGNYSMLDIYIRAVNTGNSSSAAYDSGEHSGWIENVGSFAYRATTPFMPSGVPGGAQRWRVGGRVHVPHNADGTRDPARIWMSVSYGPGRNQQQAGFFDYGLPTIPRATTAQIRIASNPVSTLDVGAAATIYLPRASSNFTHTVELWEYGTTSGVPISTLATGAGVSASWTPALSLASMFPNATSKMFFLRTITFNGATRVGSTDLVFTLTAPATMAPTISAINAADDNPDVAAAIGGFVQGQSRLKATVIADGAYGSTIAARMVTVDGATVPSGSTLPLPTSGTRAVAASATDSRGRTATANGTIQVLPYALPDIAAFSVERCTSAGVPDPSGAHLKMTLNASASSLVVGTEKNALTIRVFTRERGTSAWTARNVIAAGLAYNAGVVVTGGGIYAATTAWELRVEVADKLQASSDYFTVSTAGAILDATPTKQAFGKMVETSGPTSQIQGPARTYGDHDIDGEARHRGGYAIEPVGMLTAFAGSAAPSGWLLCDGAAVSRTTYAALFAVIGTTYGPGNGTSTFNVPNLKGRVAVGRDAAQTEFDVLGESGGTKTETLTLAQIPSHSHELSVSGVDLGYGNTTAGAGSGYGGFVNPGQDIKATATGGGQAHNNLQPYLVLNHIIKAL